MKLRRAILLSMMLLNCASASHAQSKDPSRFSNLKLYGAELKNIPQLRVPLFTSPPTVTIPAHHTCLQYGDESFEKAERIRSSVYFFKRIPKTEPKYDFNPYVRPLTYVIERRKFLNDILLAKIPHGDAPAAAAVINTTDLISNRPEIKVSHLLGNLSAAAVLDAGRCGVTSFNPADTVDSVLAGHGNDPAMNYVSSSRLVYDVLDPEVPWTDIYNDSATASLHLKTGIAASQLKDVDPCDYYLVVYKFNIPVTKPALFGVKYGFVRFNAKNVVVDTDPLPSSPTTPVDKLKVMYQANELGSGRILSIFPTNEVLSVNREDATKWSLEMKPEWAGAAGGSAKYERDITDKYDFDLPRVVGTYTSYGDTSWTFYPRKAQPIMLGAQTGAAVICIPRDQRDKNLRFQCSLDYQLKEFGVIPYPVQRLFEQRAVPLSQALPLSELIDTYALDLPPKLASSLKSTFLSAPETSIHQGARSAEDYVQKGSKIYSMTHQKQVWPPI